MAMIEPLEFQPSAGRVVSVHGFVPGGSDPHSPSYRLSSESRVT